MNIDHLVKMANQIGAFFESEPDRGEALSSVANHLKRFWDPRMRRELVAHLENGGAGLSDIVSEAIKSNRESLA